MQYRRLGQTGIKANPDGTIEASGVVDPSGNPLKWREIKPFFYQEVGGQTHLGFALAPDGTPVSWAIDDINVFVLDKTEGYWGRDLKTNLDHELLAAMETNAPVGSKLAIRDRPFKSVTIRLPTTAKP